MVRRIRRRLMDLEPANLNLFAFMLVFAASWALLGGLYSLGASYQMHSAPQCAPDDTVRTDCTFTGRAVVTAVNPPFYVFIQGEGFISTDAELPFGADTSFLHVGDHVTAVEWHGQIASISENGHTLSALGSPDHGPLAWPGVLAFAALAGLAAWSIWQFGKRTRVTLNRSYWDRT